MLTMEDSGGQKPQTSPHSTQTEFSKITTSAAILITKSIFNGAANFH